VILDMISDARRAANQQNGRRSRGPRTPAGKARSSRNAKRHGLAVPIALDAAWSNALEELGLLFCRDPDDSALYHTAMFAAAAVLDLLRIESAEVNIWNVGLSQVLSADRPHSQPGSGQDAGEQPHETGNAQELEAQAYLANISQLGSLHRYERRALSRCKRVFRSLPD